LHCLLSFFAFAGLNLKTFHAGTPCLFQREPHIDLHQLWQLLAPTVAVACTNHGSCLYQPWQLLAPTMARKLTFATLHFYLSCSLLSFYEF